ncbi:MAG TPA: signal recognition particle-docking protein FtsY [Synergistaceae bacterium]|nr:signal recognition particle-docking protein FtsY [Synergistaceae bacterium]HCP07632.1 signal recognition particle-docking protein FtsY [Synergistaceae bacterium]HCR39128.1 signal recognition particle-docking protein FtsY [Synergistaceae bacterium]
MTGLIAGGGTVLLNRLSERIDSVKKRWGISSLFSRGSIDESLWESLEEVLITGDVGVDMTERIIGSLRSRVSRGSSDRDILQMLSSVLCEMVLEVEGTGQPIRFSSSPTVVLLVGVNGSGKTTTAAKLSWKIGQEGRKAILAAADTFRAGAVEQLRIWGDRAGVRVVAHAPGGDPGAVVFDAIKAVEAGGYDCLIVDTAGRLHNRSNLMEEMSKIDRIIEKNCEGWQRETLLVIDAVSGQNGLRQVEAFGKAVPISGLIVTKYDHTAKGGVILSAGHQLGVPVRYVGIGEAMEDMVLFRPEEFVGALLESSEREV